MRNKIIFTPIRVVVPSLIESMGLSPGSMLIYLQAMAVWPQESEEVN